MLDRPLLDVLAIVGAATGVLALCYAFFVQARLRAVRTQVAAIRTLPVVVDAQRAVQHVGLVRYDAFSEAGGRLSFSVALLDGVGDGVVLTSITGRAETRTYAKTIRDSAGIDPTSPEENEAILQAMGQRHSR